MDDPNTFAGRYIDVWNEADQEARRGAISALWAPNGAHFTPNFVAQDIDAIAARVKGAHDKWVVEERCHFVAVGNAEQHHQGLRFNWHMMRGDKIASIGFDFILLDEDGRIISDHQFIDANPV